MTADGRQSDVHLGHVFTPRADGTFLEIEDGALRVDADGRLLEVGSRRDVCGEGDALQDHGSALLLPGFVDGHVHLAQVFARARVAGTLLDWLDRAVFGAELEFRDARHAERAAHAFVDEARRSGVTTAAIFLTSHAEAAERSFQVLAASGLRAITGLVHMDRGAPDALCVGAEASLAAAEKLAARWHGHDRWRIRYAFCPRYALSCSASLLQGIGRLHAHMQGTYVHTHLAESPAECAAVRLTFPEAEDYVDVYARAGLIGECTILAHAIHLSDREISALAEAGAGVVHCPSANLFLKSGVFPWQRHARSGVRFGLGSDVGAGPEMSPLRVMRDACSVQPEVFLDPAEILWRATLGGARALRLEDEVGSLEAGKEADFVVLDPARRPELQRLLPRHGPDLAAALVFLGDDRLVRSVYVRGREI